MVLLWDGSLALLDIGQEEALRYSTLQLKSCSFGHAKLEPQGSNCPALPAALGLALTGAEQATTKRKRQRQSWPLNAMEIQNQTRQMKPQAAVAAGLQHLRAWLHASGHTTVAAAAKAEARSSTAKCSLHTEAAGPATPICGLQMSPHANGSHAPRDLQSACLSQAQIADLCCVCQAAWKVLTQDSLTAASASALNPGSSSQQHPCCIAADHLFSGPPACSDEMLAAETETHDRHLSKDQLATSQQCLQEASDFRAFGQSLQSGCPAQQPPATSGSAGILQDLPALHKVKHLVKPKLVTCNRHCLVHQLLATQGSKCFPAGHLGQHGPKRSACSDAERSSVHPDLVPPGPGAPRNLANHRAPFKCGEGLLEQGLHNVHEPSHPDHGTCHAKPRIPPKDPPVVPCSAGAALAQPCSGQQADASSHFLGNRHGMALGCLRPGTANAAGVDLESCSGKLFDRVWQQPGPGCVHQGSTWKQRLIVAPEQPRLEAQQGSTAVQTALPVLCPGRQTAGKDGTARSLLCLRASQGASASAACCITSLAVADQSQGISCNWHSIPRVHDASGPALTAAQHEAPAGDDGPRVVCQETVVWTGQPVPAAGHELEWHPDNDSEGLQTAHGACSGAALQGDQPITGAGQDSEDGLGPRTESLATAHGMPVVLPAGARFLMSDIGRLQPLLPRMTCNLCVISAFCNSD